MLITHRTNSKN